MVEVWKSLQATPHLCLRDFRHWEPGILLERCVSIGDHCGITISQNSILNCPYSIGAHFPKGYGFETQNHLHFKSIFFKKSPYFYARNFNMSTYSLTWTFLNLEIYFELALGVHRDAERCRSRGGSLCLGILGAVLVALEHFNTSIYRRKKHFLNNYHFLFPLS